MNNKYMFVIILMALVAIGGTVAYANYVVSPTPTGYYLPKGYKVTAKVYVPDAPLWGNTIGDAVGLSCDKYSVIVFGWGEKTWNWEAKHGIKVIWREGGTDEDKAYVDLEPDKKHDVTIVYDWDGTVKISVDGKFIYSFVATESKYTIVAQGATVNEPEALPEPTTTAPTGSGYNRASVNELQTQYLLLGAGAAIIAVAAIMMFAKGNKKQAARTSMVLIIIIMLVLGMVGIATYYIYRSTQVTTILPFPLTEEIGNKPVLTALQFGTIQPGTVFEVIGDKEGWQIKEKDTKLYEKLELNNVDLRMNDVVTLHLYDFYVSRFGQYVLYDKPVDVNTSASPWDWTIVTSYEVYSYVTADEAGYNCAEHAIAGFSDHWGGSISFANQPEFGWITRPSTWIGNVRENFGEDSYSGWVTISASRIVDNPNQTRGTAIINDVPYSEVTHTFTDNRLAFAKTVKPCLGEIITYHATDWTGRIAYAVFYTDYTLTQLVYNEVTSHVIKTKPYLFADPTWFNGTHYFSIIDNTIGTPYNGIIRIPAEQPWLWLIKSLESDNKLHFTWFPYGTIIRIKDNSGNVVREFTITGERAGNTTLVLDYSISLDTTTLVGATVEALVPSMKVRVYAPSSSYVAILGEDGTKYGEYRVGPSGYVDIPLVNPLKNAYIVVYADNVAEEGLNIDVKDLGGGKIQVKVYNDKGVLIPGMLVRLVDPANVVLDYGVTDESGTVVLDAGRPLAEAKILVDGVWDGTIYKLSKTVTLAETMDAEVEPVANTNEQYRYALLGLFIIVLFVALVFVMKRR